MGKAGDPLPAGLAPRISEVVSGRVPGLALAVVDPDGIRWAGAIGDADISSGRSASPRMVCNWYSMTKIVTATAVLRLVERGALRLDDPAARYLPAFARLRPPQRAGQITIRHLLSHSGGLANPIPIRWVHPADKRAPDPERFLENLLARNPKVRFEPGIRASYTNIGYLALGQVVAAVAGMSYEAYVGDQILEPLGMMNTGFLFTSAMAGRAATPYHRRLSPMRLFLPRWTVGSAEDGFVSLNRFVLDGAAYGGLIGPVEDAARFLQLHLRDGELGGVRFMSAHSARQMREIRTAGRRYDLGLGWFRPRRGRGAEPAYVEHLGGGAGFWNDMRVYPGLSLGVVMMGNSTRYDHEGVNRAILGFLHSEDPHR